MRVEGVKSSQPITRVSSESVNSNDNKVQRNSNEELRDIEKNKGKKEDIQLRASEQKNEKISIGEQELIEAIERANKTLRGIDDYK